MIEINIIINIKKADDSIIILYEYVSSQVK